MDEKLNIEERTRNVLEEVRPSLQRDGGDIELVEVTDEGIAKVRLKGACGGCPMSTLTLKLGVERVLKSKLPEIKAVEAV